jgi:hypothetical protein
MAAHHSSTPQGYARIGTGWKNGRTILLLERGKRLAWRRRVEFFARSDTTDASKASVAIVN